MQNSYHLHVVSVEKEIFNGIVKKIQISGIEGEMGIYPGHSPLITLIKPGTLSLLNVDNHIEHMYLSGGIIEVQKNVVTILADTVIRATELDEQKAQESKRLAESKIKHLQYGDVNYIKIAAEISKAIAKLKVIKLSKKINF